MIKENNSLSLKKAKQEFACPTACVHDYIYNGVSTVDLKQTCFVEFSK